MDEIRSGDDVARSYNDYEGRPLAVGDFASNIESFWIGRIVAFEIHPHGYGVMARMHGTDMLAWYMGMTLEESVDEKDIQWHDPRDLRLFRKAEPAHARMVQDAPTFGA